MGRYSFSRKIVAFSLLVSAAALADSTSVERSAEKLFANISPKDAAPGSVAASPSRKDPDYFAHWIRDSALVMDWVLNQYVSSQDAKLLATLMDFAEFSDGLQKSKALTGIGEPKFSMSGEPYAGPWGRPQDDGPALRAIT